MHKILYNSSDVHYLPLYLHFFIAVQDCIGQNFKLKVNYTPSEERILFYFYFISSFTQIFWTDKNALKVKLGYEHKWQGEGKHPYPHEINLESSTPIKAKHNRLTNISIRTVYSCARQIRLDLCSVLINLLETTG